ncbi:MAG: hypothetical protein WCP55_24675 [Lentisphaerota bacterium]
MKKSLVCVLSLFMVANAFSETEKTGWEQDGLKGKVKERTVIQYTVTNNSGEDVKKIKSKSIYRYDDKGNRVELIQNDSDGITSPDVHEEKGDNVQKGEPPTCVADETLKSKKGKSRKYVIKYDNMGNKETENYVNGELKLKAKVRQNAGNEMFYAAYSVIKLVEETNYNANGDLTEKSIYKYDDKGNEIEYSVYDGKEKLIRITETSYTYY